MRMTEKARIVSVAGGRARLAILPPDDEEKCRRCPAAAICGDRAGRPRVLEAPAPEGAREGDVVTVAVEGASPAWAAFVLFVLPMAAAFACGLAAWAVLASAAGAVVAGLTGAAGAYLAIWLSGAGTRGRVEIVTDGTTGGG